MEIIKMIVGAVATVLASALGALLTILFWKVQDRKPYRVVPIVSILDNASDNIEDRLKTPGNWVVNIEGLEQYSKNRVFFFVINGHSKYCLIDCQIEVFVTVDDPLHHKPRAIRDTSYKIGTIIQKSNFIFPVEVGENVTKVLFQLKYQTEMKQKMSYELEVMICNDGFGSVSERAYLVHMLKRKKLRDNSRELKSYSSSQVGEKIKEIKGSLNLKKE